MEFLVLRLLSYVNDEDEDSHTSPSLGGYVTSLYYSFSSSCGCMCIPKLISFSPPQPSQLRDSSPSLDGCKVCKNLKTKLVQIGIKALAPCSSAIVPEK
jgi:hypothetical protein